MSTLGLMGQQKSPGEDRGQLNNSLLTINAFIFDKNALLLLQPILSAQFLPSVIQDRTGSATSRHARKPTLFSHDEVGPGGRRDDSLTSITGHVKQALGTPFQHV